MKRFCFIGFLALLLNFEQTWAQVQIIGTLTGNNFNVNYPANLGFPAVVSPGFMFTFKSTGSVTGPTTISINTGSPIVIKKQVSVDLQSGDILSGQFVTIIFDGNFFQLLNASSTSQTGWLTSGNTLSGIGILGSLNQNDVSIVTGGIERMRIITGTGYIGIGTTTPSMPLHVVSNNYFLTGNGIGNLVSSARFENLYLSNSSSIGIALHAVSKATRSSVGAVFEGQNMGIYSTASTSGNSTKTAISAEARGLGLSIGVDANANSDSSAIGLRANASSFIERAHGGWFSSNSQFKESIGIQVNSYSSNAISTGVDITSMSNGGPTSYGLNLRNTSFSVGGVGYGMNIYNTSNGPGYGIYTVNYGGFSDISVGLYASAFNGLANYAGYFANGDVFVNDRIGVGTNNPSERITVENNSYGITHRNGTGIGSVTMSTYIGNAYTNSFIPGASIGTQTDHPFFIYVNNNGEKFYVGNSTQNYNVGIGTNNPRGKLSVQGGNWDIVNTEGDLYVGDPTLNYRFKVGISLGGGGAGDVYLGAQGGSNRMFLGTSTNTQIMTIANGNIGINTNSPDQKLVVNGFTKLGNSAPPIQLAYFTGITAGAIGGTTIISLSPIAPEKIISIQVMVDWTGNNDYIQPSYSLNPGYFYNWFTSGSNLNVININNATANPIQTSNSILSKPIKVIVTYIP